MASAEAQIQIAVKNLNALTKLDKQLNKINKTNETLLRSLDKLTLSVDNLARSKGFENISRGASAARKEINEANKSMSGFAKLRSTLVSTGGGRRALAVGALGLGVGANSVVNQLKNIKQVAFSALNPFNKGVEAAAVKTGILSGKLTALGSLIAAQPQLAGAAAVAYMAFGNKLGEVAVKGIVNLTKGLGGIGQAATNSAALAIDGYKDLELQIELTREASIRLNTSLNAPSGAMFNRKGISNRNRPFGMRQVGTPAEEQVRRRNRRINEMAARHREDRLVTTAIAGPGSKRAGQEIKRLKSIDANQAKTAAESKKSNSILSSQALFGPTAYQPPIPGLGPVTSGTGFTAAQYGPQQLPNTLRSGFQRQRNRLGIGKFANPQGMFASRKGRQGRIGGALTSGMIGGGFPLLFGQSPLASILGGIGGAAGGALGGGLGFGLSIAGTALAQQIQETLDFRKAIGDLNTEMKGMGFSAGVSAQEITKLGKSLGITKQEAVQVASQFKRFGPDATGLATLFQGDAAAFSSTIQANDFESTINAIKEAQKDLTIEQEAGLMVSLQKQGVEETINKLIDIRKQKILTEKAEEQRKAAVRTGAIPFGLGPIISQMIQQPNQAKDLEKTNTELDDVIVKLNEIKDRTNDTNKAAQAALRSVNAELERLEKELTVLNDPAFQLVSAAKSIGDAFSESFKGVISGTMSVQEAFANMFKRIADHFLDMAARMAANKLMTSILSAFAPAAIGSSLGNATLPTDVGGLTTKQAFSGGAMIKYASGGYVTRPTVGLVGEAGEDEYVIPASKMASSMQRYSAGARGDSVIAGGGSSYAGGGGGSSTTVSYSGPILNFNSEEFVPKSAVGQIIASAAKQGASMGETRTMKSMQNNRSARARIGM